MRKLSVIAEHAECAGHPAAACVEEARGGPGQPFEHREDRLRIRQGLGVAVTVHRHVSNRTGHGSRQRSTLKAFLYDLLEQQAAIRYLLSTLDSELPVLIDEDRPTGRFEEDDRLARSAEERQVVLGRTPKVVEHSTARGRPAAADAIGDQRNLQAGSLEHRHRRVPDRGFVVSHPGVIP